ncbi:16S rRNA (cytidine1402-2'-O)-methyltransferase [Desulfacinum hydrothermale DSM 13146]|uniref:Ribosomal RNA small subunit methyltransferase I n=1 Tax=Desulfacinum hydrothermale DSM 13146 TaxID=1121390 RepID=A0A1W1XQL2_9BACT|nr:16S rRNA (cytidine(1402)-2'-O)-methyltransferase [Desulfacinum hydrothermale]SMC25801.1 16S rRNA (cytidine1402-2'-O)-methyltransferase [Desulfacinum hydrothermale DSM 13146]
MTQGKGTLYVVATPIGNLEDISLRALDVLRRVAAIAAEDTRHTRKLLSRHEIHTPLESCHAHSSRQRLARLVQRLEEGDDLALVTDAGTPAVSDPGGELIAMALERGLPVAAVPGPSAALAALVVSGLPTHPFAFLGFAPPKGGRRKRFFETYAHLPMTRILYEAPGRLLRTLRDILDHWGDRRIAVARELTKIHEEVFRGTVREALDHFECGVRGEISLVVEGAPEPASEREEGAWLEELEQLLLAEGFRLKSAVGRVCERYQVRRKEVYQAALQILKAHEEPMAETEEGSEHHGKGK